jgi:hypoxanthine-guanine phosphoribosyltransferase
LENIKYKNHNFKKYLTENDIFERINELAEILNKSYKGKNPIIVGVLNGCVFLINPS